MNVQDNIALRRTLLFGVPACYLVLTLLHPTENPELGDDAGLFMILHVVQLFLIAGMACVIWVLTAGNTSRAAQIARGLILPYVITYTAFEAVAGFAAGELVHNANSLDQSDKPAADRLIDDLLAGDPAGYVFYVVVAVVWVTAMGATIASLRGRAPAGALVLLAVGTLVFGVGHPRPTGSIGMSLILIGMIWMELAPRQPAARAADDDEPLLHKPTAKT